MARFVPSAHRASGEADPRASGESEGRLRWRCANRSSPASTRPAAVQRSATPTTVAKRTKSVKAGQSGASNPNWLARAPGYRTHLSSPHAAIPPPVAAKTTAAPFSNRVAASGEWSFAAGIALGPFVHGRPDRESGVAKVVLGFSHRVLAEVEDRGCKHGACSSFHQSLPQVLQGPGTA